VTSLSVNRIGALKEHGCAHHCRLVIRDVLSLFLIWHYVLCIKLC